MITASELIEKANKYAEKYHRGNNNAEAWSAYITGYVEGYEQCKKEAK